MNWDPINMTSAQRREAATMLLQRALVTGNTRLITLLVDNLSIIDRTIKNIDDTLVVPREGKHGTPDA